MTPVPRPRRLFALDQNFPEPILNALSASLPMAELVPVRHIQPDLAKVEDWELMLRLHQHERAWDGLITNDASLLALPAEMTVLAQTRMTLVVVRGEGHNPIRATGVLLCHLPFVCHHTRRSVAQVWDLRVSNKGPEEVQSYLDRIADKTGTDSAELFRRHRLEDTELRPPKWRDPDS